MNSNFNKFWDGAESDRMGISKGILESGNSTICLYLVILHIIYIIIIIISFRISKLLEWIVDIITLYNNNII